MQIIQSPPPTYRQSSKDAGTLQELSDKKTVELLMSYVKPDAKNFRSYFFRTSRNVTPLKTQIKKYDHNITYKNQIKVKLNDALFSRFVTAINNGAFVNILNDADLLKSIEGVIANYLKAKMDSRDQLSNESLTQALKLISNQTLPNLNQLNLTHYLFKESLNRIQTSTAELNETVLIAMANTKIATWKSEANLSTIESKLTILSDPKSLNYLFQLLNHLNQNRYIDHTRDILDRKHTKIPKSFINQLINRTMTQFDAIQSPEKDALLKTFKTVITATNFSDYRDTIVNLISNHKQYRLNNKYINQIKSFKLQDGGWLFLKPKSEY